MSLINNKKNRTSSAAEQTTELSVKVRKDRGAFFKSKNFRRGGLSLGITIALIAVVLLVYLLIGRLPSAATQYDISSTKIYDITETTTNVVDGLEHDIRIVILTDPDSLDTKIETFVKKYVALSDHLSMEIVDTVQHPTAPESYGVSDDSIAVICDETGLTQSIALSDMFEYDEMSYYYYGTTEYTAFDGEGQLTSAVNYVSSGNESTIYLTTGHGEADFSESLYDLLNKSGVSSESLDLMKATEIPEDCDLLIVNAPATDLNESELTMLSDYMDNGGKLIVLLSTADYPTPELNAFLEKYGMHVEDGYVEDSASCYQGNPYAIIPSLNLDEELANGMASDTTLVYGVQGMSLVSPENDSFTASSFMTTSSQAQIVNYTEDSASSTGYNETVTNNGSFVLAAVSENEETGARLTAYSCYSLIDSSITDSFSSLQNLTLFVNSVTANMENVTNLSIASKSMEVEYNTVTRPGLFGIVLIVVVPLAILIWGFVTWFKRRKL